MTLSIKKAQRMHFEALLLRYGGGGGRVDAAAEQNHSFPGRHNFCACRFCRCHRMALFVPADDTLLEDFHIAVTVFVENAISQTCQVMGTCSIQHYWSVARDTF